MSLEKDIKGLVKFIQTEVEGAGKTGCVVGLSGGIDSAVIASLCKIAFPDTTFCVNMPTAKNMNSTFRAADFAHDLSCNYFVDALNYEQMKLCEVTDLAIGNFNARMRMAKLYYWAECYNSLVIGTDNKCENYIGYFTKYGDGGVDINPIGQYMKSEVFELGKILGVSDAILNATPSAELMNGQTDEGELGFTYDQLEWAIKILETDPLKILEVGDSDKVEILTKVHDMHLKTEHKRIISKEYERKV